MLPDYISLEAKMTAGIRLDYQEVREYFEKHGCQLLETEYKNARTKMRYRCKCGEESEIRFDSFRKGNRCRSCGNKVNSKKQRLSQKQAEEKFSKIGCELLSEYKKASEKVKFRCHCGRLDEALPNNIWRRGRCKFCGLEARSGFNHYDWRPDRENVELEYAFRQRCYKLIKMSLNVTGRVKNEKTAALLGYDYKQLREHIESHPNWKNVKGGAWHVDHIFPIKAFSDYGISDLKIINSLCNLQPLEAIENCRKNGKYDADEFEKYLESKGVKYERPDCRF